MRRNEQIWLSFRQKLSVCQCPAVPGTALRRQRCEGPGGQRERRFLLAAWPRRYRQLCAYFGRKIRVFGLKSADRGRKEASRQTVAASIFCHSAVPDRVRSQAHFLAK